jgi:hypothetical protein
MKAQKGLGLGGMAYEAPTNSLIGRI